MINIFRKWLNEPRAENPPHRVRRDWFLIGLTLTVLAFEVTVRSNGIEAIEVALRPKTVEPINYRLVTVPIVVAMVLSLGWRRSHPFKTFTFTFGGIIAFDVASVLGGFEPINIFTSAILLILMYSLFRWGSGTEMAIGTVIGFAVFTITSVLEYTGVSDLVGGLIVLEFPAAVALAVRYGRRSAEQGREQIRRAERETLARELHDTVAHHVSAIAIQAQAGQFVAGTGSLEGATEALAVIEEEASRALTEMRSIVEVLRGVDSDVALAPQISMADVQALASAVGPPIVEVKIDSDLGDVGSAVVSATYRIAMEAVTNARRHARNASTVIVEVAAESATAGRNSSTTGSLHVTVTDDGNATEGAWIDGYGLIGMKERAALLGGNLEAGPRGTTGWQVKASLPYKETQ